MEVETVSNVLRHLANHAGVKRHEGQLQSVELCVGQVVHREAGVDGVVGVVGKRHLLAQHDEDA